MSSAYAFDPSPALAPWAEIVPGAGPMTIEDLLALPGDDGWRYELVEGVLFRVAGSGEQASTIGGNIYFALRTVVQQRRLGVVTPADGAYTFPGAETGLVPDVGFYVASRRALIADRTKPIPFAPDLAVEVASPTQSASDMAAKARRYLRGGIRLVWVAWPERSKIDIWRTNATAPTATLDATDTLDGEDVVPGFAIPVAELFADPLD